MSGIIAAVLAFTSAVLHVAAQQLAGLDPVASPIADLSRTAFGNIQNLGLLLFALAHFALAYALGSLAGGPLWQAGRIAIVIAGVSIIGVAVWFGTPDAAVQTASITHDPLSYVASAIGLAMGLLLPGLRRHARGLWGFDLVVLAAWLGLVLLLFFLSPSWLGAYERGVALTYAIWIVGMGLGLGRHRRTDPTPH